MSNWFVPRKLDKRGKTESIPPEKSLNDEQIIVLTKMISDAIRDRWSALENEVSDPVVLLQRVGLVIENYPWGPLWHEFSHTLVVVKNSLQPVAEFIVRSSEINWWWSAMAQTSQIELSHWWIAPINDHIPRTTRGPIGSWLSVSLLCPGDPEQMHLDNLNVWQVQTSTNANIYEVRGTNDWVALVERFPRDLAVAFNRDWSRWTGQAGPWLLPDWKAISENYDGVHISIAGFIAAAYQALPVRDGFTILTGWRLDETLWLGKTPTAIQQLA